MPKKKISISPLKVNHIYAAYSLKDPNFKIISSLDRRNKTFVKLLATAEQILNNDVKDGEYLMIKGSNSTGLNIISKQL